MTNKQFYPAIFKWNQAGNVHVFIEGIYKLGKYMCL
jgi:hypothetical protein